MGHCVDDCEPEGCEPEAPACRCNARPVTFGQAFFLLLLYLKLTNQTEAPWWAVLLPVWFLPAASLLSFAAWVGFRRFKEWLYD